MDDPFLNIEEREAINSGRWFSSLSPSLRHDILRCAYVKRYRDGELIAARGDPPEEWIACAKGAVRVSSTSISGKQITLTYVEPGIWFGDVAIFDNEAFLRTVVDKVEPYEGEQVVATIYLYTRHNLQQVPAVQAEASTDGFWVQDLLSATRSLEPTRQVIKGRGYWVYVLRRFAAFPLRSGELTIGSMSLTLTRDSLFDLFDPMRGPASLDRKSVPVLLHRAAAPVSIAA